MYKLSIALLPICLLVATACTQQATVPVHPPRDSSMNSLDWAGTYRGYLPCADCAGVETSITLNKDLSWLMLTRYDIGMADQFEQGGRFSWAEDGNHIRLEGILNASARYQVGENHLVQLDLQGNRITGVLADKYILNKVEQSDYPGATGNLFGVRWRMLAIAGRKPESAPDSLPYIQFAPETNSISGFAGCNHFSGTYELLPGNRLRFSQMTSTMMACRDMSVETELLTLLSTVDNYTISGKSLSLNRARMAPLLVFEAVTKAK